MKTVISSTCIIALAISISASAASTFDMEISDGTLEQAASLVNDFCKSEIAPIKVENPSVVVSIKFESISCEQAAELIREFDTAQT